MVLPIHGTILETGHIDKMKLCKHCKIILNSDNASKKNAKYWRNECKSCRSKKVIEFQKIHKEKINKRVNLWKRLTGRIKQYECENCGNLCIKQYARAFCSDKCRFLAYVQKSDNDCWNWLGSKNRGGYGLFSSVNDRHGTAHRVSYKLFKGEIPENMQVCHTCDNPACVKPAHLWLGTTQDNKKDQLNKGRGFIKLNAKDILEIRKLSENGIGSMTIARLFEVTCATISSIIKRRSWKHV